MNDKPIPIIFFSGLAADAEVFVSQKVLFPQITVPAWLPPQRGETLTHYCARLAEPYREAGPCIVGGASFGGIVAQHVASHLDAKAVVLIGSVRSPGELPWYAVVNRPLRPLISLLPVRVAQFLAAPLGTDWFRVRIPMLCGLARQFRRSDARVFKWSLKSILAWREPIELTCPVYHIHGSHDRVLPVRYTRPDRVVDDGGHVISITHPGDVNEYLKEIVDLHS